MRAQQKRYVTAADIGDCKIRNAVPVYVSHSQLNGTCSHRKGAAGSLRERARAAPQQHRYSAVILVCRGEILTAVSIEVGRRDENRLRSHT